MSFSTILRAHPPLRLLQHIKSGHANLSTSTFPLAAPHPYVFRKHDYLRDWVLRATTENTSSSASPEQVDADAAPAAAVSSATTTETTTPPSPYSDNPFFQLGVDDRLLYGLDTMRITAPTPIQSASIPPIFSGSNVALQCYTGSGKTLAFILPVLSLAVQRAETEWAGVTRRTRAEAGIVQAIVVTPSRELAMQIVRVAQSLLPETARRAVQQCIGGANTHRQREALKLYKPLLVVGTPGRLAELSRDGTLQTHKCGILVLDEADQLLAPQFREEMGRLSDHVGRRVEGGRQTILVSATLTPKVLKLCDTWCPSPYKVFMDVDGSINTNLGAAESDVENSGISARQVQPQQPSWGWGAPMATSYNPEITTPNTGSVGGWGSAATTTRGGTFSPTPSSSVPPHLVHTYVISTPQHRVDTLRKTIHALGAQRVLVFMNFQQRLKDVAAKLATRKGMRVASLHGEMTKQERQTTLSAFRAGKYRVLMVSDVAARGLDVPECDAVFNLELPSDASHYAHRAGRTGRAGREGVVVTIATPGEKFVVEKLGSRLGIDIKPADVRYGDVELLNEFEEEEQEEEQEEGDAVVEDGGDLFTSTPTPSPPTPSEE